MSRARAHRLAARAAASSSSLSIVLIFGALIGSAACSTAGVSEPDAAAAAHPAVRNVALISIDTLRADHLGAYGYGAPTSPRLDAFAARSTLFTDCEAGSAHTLASHKSLLSGRYASSFLASYSARGGPRRPTPLPLDIYRLALALWPSPPLAQRLKEAGFATSGWTDGGFVRSLYGFSRGFDEYADVRAGLDANRLRAQAWIEAHSDRPWFVFLHGYDVHCPYDPPRRFLDVFEPTCDADLQFHGSCGKSYFNALRMSAAQTAHLGRHYDAGIRRADEALGAFLDFLERTGRFEDTLIIVTSDHGESLGEHGFVGHGELNENQLHVPLLVHVPGGQGSVVTTPVAGVDILPTILDMTTGRVPSGLDGTSLRGLLEARMTLRTVRELAARARFASIALGEDRGEIASLRKIAVRSGGSFKLVYDADTRRCSLFDLARDPGEIHDLAGSGLPVEAALRALAMTHDPGPLRGLDPRAPRRPDEESLTPEIREELHSLGYAN